MNCRISRQYALIAAVGVTFTGFCLSARAANLLLNPGFEFPTSTVNPDPQTPTDWTFYSVGTQGGLDIERASYNNANTQANHTPGGTYGIWMKTFESGNQGVYQKVSSGVQGNTPYTFSGWYYFEANFAAASDAVVDVELTFLGASNNDLGGDTATYIYANPQAQSDNASWVAGNATAYQSFVSPPANTWTQYSVTANAPAGTATVVASFDYYALNASSGSNISAFADDGDLEGAGNPPTTPVWSPDSSGDWNSTGNWSTFTVPNGVGVEADFFGAITKNRNVYTDIPVTVGTLNFNNANKYVIDGAGSLTLQSGTTAQVIVQQGTQEINLPVTLASNTVFNVSSGANLIIGDPLTISSGVNLTQTGTGTVTYESTITGLSGPSASKLDVGHADTLIGIVNGSQSSIVAALQSGYADGAWNGVGINSSAASFAAGTSVGYDVSGSQVEVRYTWIGDLNLDGVVDSADANAMGTAGGGWQHGDLNYDGVVNADDYSLFAYGLAKAGGQNINSVPEPAALGFLAAAGLLARRRRA